MRCTACNWTRHDASIHGELCPQGHPIAIVGRYANGSCRACHRAIVRTRYHRDPEGERARHLRWRTRPRDGTVKRAFLPGKLPRGWQPREIARLATALRDHMRRPRRKPVGREAGTSQGAGALPLGRRDPAPASIALLADQEHDLIWIKR